MAENSDSNSASNNLLNIGANESELGHDPKHHSGPPRVLLPAELSQELDQEAHDRGPHQKPQQRVASNGTRLKIPLQVSRVQKRYAHQKARPSKQP
ncbi:hypothetical protein CR513_28997, partial [Mucuna pruriens]